MNKDLTIEDRITEARDIEVTYEAIAHSASKVGMLMNNLQVTAGYIENEELKGYGDMLAKMCAELNAKIYQFNGRVHCIIKKLKENTND